MSDAPQPPKHRIVAAHDQVMTLHVIAHVPPHEPRETDPAYHLFNEAKARIKAAGQWFCNLNDDYCAGGIELHHSSVEFSQQSAMDFERVNKALGFHIKSEDEFAAWIESPDNLETLCVNHHRTHFGTHMLPGPLWNPLRFRKIGVAAGGEFVAAKDLPKGKP
jgi:hypothetical protein